MEKTASKYTPNKKQKPDSSTSVFRSKKDTNSAPSRSSNQSEKKPFDKKAWRIKKYSNKYKLEQWENKRKNKVEKEYQKQIKHQPKVDVQKIYEQDSDTEAHNDNNTNEDLQSEQQQMKRKSGRRDKEQFQEELKIKQIEKAAALAAYKKKKIERFKILNRKTKRGQPLMKGRMELLLEDIQNSLQK